MVTTAEFLREEQAHEQPDLVRGREDRHVQRVAIGGAIALGYRTARSRPEGRTA